MKRNKKPQSVSTDKKKIQTIVAGLSSDWNADERETSILFDYGAKIVYLETTYPATARRWFNNLWGDKNVKFNEKASSLQIAVPWEYCRQADLILKPKHRGK